MRVEGIFIADIATQAYTAFNGDKYETVDYPAVINGVSSIGSYTLSNGEYSLDAVIEYVNDYGNTIMYVSLPEEYPYYIGVAVVGDGYDPNNPPKFRLTGYDAKEFSTLGKTLIVGRHAAATKDAADIIITEETAFKEEFGMQFLSSREYMILHGLEEAGLTATTQDEEDIANGIIPTSLRTDTVHFNTYGYTIYLNLIYRRLKELGYISE